MSFSHDSLSQYTRATPRLLSSVVYFQSKAIGRFIYWSAAISLSSVALFVRHRALSSAPARISQKTPRRLKNPFWASVLISRRTVSLYLYHSNGIKGPNSLATTANWARFTQSHSHSTKAKTMYKLHLQCEVIMLDLWTTPRKLAEVILFMIQ